jgi:DNA-3-methyladenine glycosylase I
MLWEMLMLEGLPGGLSWSIVLRKREAFRAAFAGFEPAKVARFGARDVTRLMNDAGIIRARAKIEATIRGAQIYCEMEQRGESFSAFCWSFTGGKVLRGNGRTQSSQFAVVRAHLEGAEAARLQVRRPDDRLRLDAGGRHRQRSLERLFQAQVMRRRRYGACAMASAPRRH